MLVRIGRRVVSMFRPFLFALLVLCVAKSWSVYGDQFERYTLSETTTHEINESSDNKPSSESSESGSQSVLVTHVRTLGITDKTLTVFDKIDEDHLLAKNVLSKSDPEKTPLEDKYIEISKSEMLPSIRNYWSANLTAQQPRSEEEEKIIHQAAVSNSTFESVHAKSPIHVFDEGMTTEEVSIFQENSTGSLQRRSYILPSYYNEKLKQNLIPNYVSNETITRAYNSGSNRTSNESIPDADLRARKASGFREKSMKSNFTSLNLKQDENMNLVNSMAKSKNELQNVSTNTEKSVFQMWKELQKDIKSRTDSVLKKALPKILSYKTHVNISSSCTSSIMQFFTGLRNFKSWAVRMVDANGRFPSGSLSGTFTDLGDYDQCLNVIYSSSRRNRPKIRGQYCTLELKPLMPSFSDEVNFYSHTLDFGNASKDSVLSDLSHASTLFYIMVLRIGICIPSLCSENDIKQLATVALKKIPVEVSVRNCEVKQPVSLTMAQIIILSFVVLIFLLVVSGTMIYHCFIRTSMNSHETGRLRLSIEAFSATANLQQLMKSNRSAKLASVNGIRCLSLMWIVLAHTYGFGHRQGLAQLSNARQYMDDVPFQIITNAWVSVDTFFMIGGLLVSMPNLKSMEKTKGKMNFINHILHRIWRLTPPVAATIGIMFLLPLIGSGPLWRDMVGHKVANCERGWWQAILPLNTWINFDNMCLLHTWYIAADLHFYCLSPLILILLYRWPTIGFVALFLMTAFCALVSGLLTFFYELPPTVIFFSPNVQLTKKTANLLYFRPYPHLGAYCVGIILGYVLWKHRKVIINWPGQLMGWSLSAVSCLAVLFATYPWNRNQMPAVATSIIYAMTHRTVWAAGVAWVIFMCATGHGGILNQFLSWKLFGPLSKLSYSMYLLHFPILWVRVSWRRTLLNFRHYDVVTEFFGILVVTLLLSVLFHIAFEAPFLKLEEIWFPRRRIIKKHKPNISVK